MNSDSDEYNSSWGDADFSGLDDPEALRQFLGNYDYLLETSDSDSSEGNYHLARERPMAESSRSRQRGPDRPRGQAKHDEGTSEGSSDRLREREQNKLGPEGDDAKGEDGASPTTLI